MGGWLVCIGMSRSVFRSPSVSAVIHAGSAVCRLSLPSQYWKKKRREDKEEEKDEKKKNEEEIQKEEEMNPKPRGLPLPRTRGRHSVE